MSHVVLGIDPELADLVPEFLDHQREDLAAMGEALAAGDLERVRALAHQSKGCAAGYGFSALGGLAAELEAAARAGDPTATGAALTRFGEYVQNLDWKVAA